MIDTLYFGIGFIIYVFFTVLTFKVYSKKKEVTKSLILGMIYFYYSMLAAWLIFKIDFDSSLFERIFQVAVYWIICGFYVLNYFNYNIKEKDSDYSEL